MRQIAFTVAGGSPDALREARKFWKKSQEVQYSKASGSRRGMSLNFEMIA